MAATPTLIQTPKLWSGSFGSSDSAWALLLTGTNLGGGGANGSKITGLNCFTNDTVSRVMQLFLVRALTVTVTVATPAVLSIAASAGNNLTVGDRMIFTTSGAMPTGITAGGANGWGAQIYYVISAGWTPGVSFEIAASAGGSTINTSGTQSGVHTAWIARLLGQVAIPASAGNLGNASVDLLSSGTIPGLPVDGDGQQYILLESGDYLAFQPTTTPTANKVFTMQAVGGNF